MGCLCLPCVFWLIVGILRSALTSPRSSSQTVWSPSALSLQMLRLSFVPTFSVSLHVWSVVAEGSLSVSLVDAPEDFTHFTLREGHGEAAKENHIVSPNGSRGLMELCPQSGKASHSTDRPFILSKGSFILSQGYVAKTSLMMIVIPSGLRCWNDLSCEKS